ncbi:MarR family winged helix-turn-helix transcriptional regulator [Hoeflea sp. WL0058]|uniref:MarR family winged helix-turn-helix transcriptional regulator n=1 Tax=Flavimaribacter sediminis TaxID=2865987 RepID=A0AAE2ZNC0_9HYPH|nr:MarR family winged helix-turn-helix transcriptional regulator [Flavimaribacter sediminis]MBW8637860.1 MarR family winged helix-turn-helix transcriptional regulator [Flavimaribacter sediminis]GKX34117.1 MAG: hypothetical protein MnENMB40S_17350 [Rhizobiaceae bacterium MnEN-MB40S]
MTANHPSEPRRDIRLRDTVAYRLILTMNRMVKPFMEEHSRRLKLTLSEWRVINALAASPMSSGEEIARSLNMEKMTVSRSLRSLEKAKRVSHRKDPENLKRNQWQLTDQGWDLFDTLAPTALEHQDNFLSRLTARERETLSRLLGKLVE